MEARTRGFVGVAAVALCLVAVEAQSDGEVAGRTVEIDPAGVISIDAGSTSVQIAGWDEPHVLIEAPVGSAAGLDIQRYGLRASIEVASESERPSDLRLRLPADMRVEVATTSGRIDIEAFVGALTIQTLSGATRIVGRPARVTIDTISGAVLLLGGADRAAIETVSGAIELDGPLDSVQIDAVSAPVTVRSTATVERLDVDTVNGVVTFAGALAAGARVDLESHA